MRFTYKTYYRCSGDTSTILGLFGDELRLTIDSFTFNGVLEDDGSYSSAPAWFGQSNGFPALDTWWAMTPPVESGTHYNFSWDASNKDGSTDEYIVELIMNEACVEFNYETCNLNVLYWITREGGFMLFPFTGKKTFTVKIPDGKIYTDTNYTKRLVSRNGVFSGGVLSTGQIPESSLDVLESLKESIQVYLIDNIFSGAERKVYPVILEDGDFTKKKTGDKIFDIKIKFYYAEEKRIQSQ